MEKEEIVDYLKSLVNKKNIEGMARFGINPQGTLGIPIPKLRELAKKIKKKTTSDKNHQLANKLWQTKIHEARLLAIFIDDYKLVTEEQMDEWVEDFDSWDIVDQCCSNLFDKTPFVLKKINQWASRKEEFVRRTAFVLMATSAVHNKTMTDKEFEKFFPLIIKYSTDDRNFVKKAVNWALRQIGKRNVYLNKRAIFIATKILSNKNKTARWVGNNALNELTRKFR